MNYKRECDDDDDDDKKKKMMMMKKTKKKATRLCQKKTRHSIFFSFLSFYRSSYIYTVCGIVKWCVRKEGTTITSHEAALIPNTKTTTTTTTFTHCIRRIQKIQREMDRWMDTQSECIHRKKGGMETKKSNTQTHKFIC